MKSLEFEKWVRDRINTIGLWRVEINKNSSREYTMGCFFDTADRKWKVYSNEEKGRYIVYLETESEEEAYDELKSMVIFEQRNNKEYI